MRISFKFKLTFLNEKMEIRYFSLSKINFKNPKLLLTLNSTKGVIMKTMKCNNLGGASSKEFSANSFEEIAELIKRHAMEMTAISDTPHLEAMNKMRELIETPDAMQNWFKSKRK